MIVAQRLVASRFWRIPVIGLLAGLALQMAVPKASAASFVCKPDLPEMERAICSNHGLSEADETLDFSYQFLLQSCMNEQDAATLRASQRVWSTEGRAAFEQAADGVQLLRLRYAERNVELGGMVQRCQSEQGIETAVIVKALRSAPKLRIIVPLVLTRPPEIGRKINRALFDTVLKLPVYRLIPVERMGDGDGWLRVDTILPAPERFSEGVEVIRRHRQAFGGDATWNYSVALNNGRLLVLEFDSVFCGASCGRALFQHFFDARTGRHVGMDDLFSAPTKAQLVVAIEKRWLRRAEAILAKGKGRTGRFSNEEAEFYLRCIDQRRESFDRPDFAYRRDPVLVYRQSAFAFLNDGCGERLGEWTALEFLDEVFAPERLRPHLTAYGRSLLLGEGDVRDSASESRGKR